MDSDSPITLKTFDTEWEAELARINLERAGIFALVKSGSVKGFSGPALIVSAEDASRALKVLNEFDDLPAENSG
jgi:hypothetical protein